MTPSGSITLRISRAALNVNGEKIILMMAADAITNQNKEALKMLRSFVRFDLEIASWVVTRYREDKKQGLDIGYMVGSLRLEEKDGAKAKIVQDDKEGNLYSIALNTLLDFYKEKYGTVEDILRKDTPNESVNS